MCCNTPPKLTILYSIYKFEMFKKEFGSCMSYVFLLIMMHQLVKKLPVYLFCENISGYPVVTLGFGFKSYIGYRMRQRKQQVVAKENLFYMQLMQQALPVETVSATTEQAETTATLVVPAQPVQNNKVHNK